MSIFLFPPPPPKKKNQKSIPLPRGGGNSEKCTPLIIVVFRFEGEMVQCVRQYEADLQNMVEIQKKQVYFKLQHTIPFFKGSE